MVQDREEALYHRIDCAMGDKLWSKTGKKLIIIELTVPWGQSVVQDREEAHYYRGRQSVVQDREEAHYHRTDSTIGDNL